MTRNAKNRQGLKATGRAPAAQPELALAALQQPGCEEQTLLRIMNKDRVPVFLPLPPAVAGPPEY